MKSLASRPSQFISLTVSGLGDDRQTSLQIGPTRLSVLGMLRHAEYITLSSQTDADKLRCWLDANFPQQKKRSAARACQHDYGTRGGICEVCGGEV